MIRLEGTSANICSNAFTGSSESLLPSFPFYEPCNLPVIGEQKNSNKNFDSGEDDVGYFWSLKVVSHPFLLIVRKHLLAEGRDGIGYNKTAYDNNGNTENRRTMNVQRKTVLIEAAFQS